MIEENEFIEICRNVMDEKFQNISITHHSRFIEDMAFDSLTMVALIVELEAFFSSPLIHLAEDIVEIETVKQAVDFFNTKVF
ncbi:hypothetical protein [Alcanivorax sp.]|uniref:hypothetical protein n=1 Tax=Alcanivorax sp. TaxID=1872427 RepID=UPI002B266D15|nr:hypothetical protein [Alcanivorax sp.]